MNADLELANVDQAKVLAALGLNVNDPKAQATLLICQRYELDALLGHMVLVQNKPYVTRDGYLHIAHRSGVFDGMEVLDEGENDRGIFCKVAVYRKDMSRPFTAIGRVKKGEKTMVDPYDMALTRAQRRALRLAFNVAGVIEFGGPEDDAAEFGVTVEPFDATVEPVVAATSAKQVTERKTLARVSQDMKADDPVAAVVVAELSGRAQALDAEHQDLAKGLMKKAGLSAKKAGLTRGDARRIDELLADVERAQAEVWEDRRKAVFAAGLSGDEVVRHNVVAKATARLSADDGGQTGSTKYLTEVQTHAILDALETAEVEDAELQSFGTSS